MKTLHLAIIIAIPIAFFSGMAFTMFVTSHASNEPNSDVKSQVGNMTSFQDNGSNYAIVNPNTNRIYVANEVNSTVVVIDGNTNEKIADIPVDASTQIAVNPDTNRIYITEPHLIHNTEENNIEQSGTIAVIDGSTNTKIASIQIGAGSFGIDVNHNTNRIYVLHRHFVIIGNKWQNGTVSVIDGNTNTKIASIPIGANPAGIAVNPDTNRIYVTNYNEGTVSVIDGTNNKITDNLILKPGVEGIAINPVTNRIYVADGITSTLYVIDGETGSKKSEITVSGWNVAINPSTNRIFVPDYFFNNLSVIDGRYDDIMSVIPIGVYP